MTRWMTGLMIVLLTVSASRAADKLTPAAAKTQDERLKVKATVEWKNKFLRECLAELNSAFADADLGKIELKYDTGVSMNTRMTYSAKDKPVAEILKDFLNANDMAYVVISKKGDKTDGGLLIKKK